MTREEFAAKLSNTEKAEHENLFRVHSAFVDVELAYILKNTANQFWHNDPTETLKATIALESLSTFTNQPEIQALSIFAKGILALSEHHSETAIELFNQARTLFEELDKKSLIAEVKSRKVIALSILGRYDEAIENGLQARQILLTERDVKPLILLEYNLGNLYLRRDLYQSADEFFIKATERATAINDCSLLALLLNSRALLHSSQNKFREAEKFYKQALDHATATNQAILQADIETNIGELALFQGRFNHALDFLEKANRSFYMLGNKQRSALVELEIADAYLELNLKPEAKERYEKLSEVFGKLGMRAERARVLAQKGHALIALKQTEQAKGSLAEAQKLYQSEGNPIGEALTKLLLAQILYDENKLDEVERLTEEIEQIFNESQAWRHLLLARWLRGESKRKLKKFDEAEKLLLETSNDAENQIQPQINEKCLTSLGLLKAQIKQEGLAESYFKKAVELIENMRAPLPGEEFRAAFFAEKITPYHELMRLYLKEERRYEEAFHYAESARSRALADALGSGMKLKANDDFEAKLIEQIETLREELNWFYSQFNRIPQNAKNSEIENLNQTIRHLEKKIQDLTRQIHHRKAENVSDQNKFDLGQLKQILDKETALVEYSSVQGEWLAFVLTDEQLFVVRNLGNEVETLNALEQFHFQIGSLKYGSDAVRRHLPLLTKRAQQHLKKLYEELFAPIESLIGGRRVVIVPHGVLHYVPFHALFDGEKYVIEKREVSYTPGATILLRSFSKPGKRIEKALLMGVSDERAPMVKDEVESLAPLFSDAISYINEEATIAVLRQESSTSDLIHLACHGQFRFDNPTFSTLKLGDGWLTVQDAAELDFNCELVTLSACETGVNLIAPGDELLGLLRGFFSAGTPSLVLSLWSVDDTATKSLMLDFYKNIMSGNKPVTALRQSQLKSLKETSHPFFWSPFVLIGRW